MFPVYLVQLFCVASLAISFRNGETVQSRLNDYKHVHRAKRAMTPAMKGVLAWRKLLWNSKPNSRTSKNSYNGYHKEGDFSNARDDFLSVVPDARMSYYRGKKVYEGVVGDRRVVLRERGVPYNEYPTIEIMKGYSTDKIFYMGKGWNRIFYKRKQ